MPETRKHKPCPHCGSASGPYPVQHVNDLFLARFGCLLCGATCPGTGSTRTEALSRAAMLWDRRT